MKTAINIKHPMWSFKKTKTGMIGIMKKKYWEKLIKLQLSK